MNHLINEQLKKVGWEAKFSIYHNKVESISTSKIKTPSPLISIIMICWKTNPLLNSALQALKQQTLQNFELIFVDNGSEQGTLDWVRDHADTFIRMKKNDGAYLARNIGALYAHTPIMLFLEDDGIADERLLEAHYKAHITFSNAVSIRGVCLPINLNQNENYRPHHYYYGWDILPYFPDLEGNASFKTDFFYHIKGWNDSIRFGHGGTELMQRVMTQSIELPQFLYIPTAILRHDYAKSIEQLDSKKELQVSSKKALLELYPEWNKNLLKWQSVQVQALSSKHFDNKRRNKSLALLNDFRDVFERHSEGIEHLKKGRLITLSPTEMLDFSLQAINKKTYIYGASSKGGLFYEFCQAYSIKITAFVDSNPEKHGKQFNNLPILAPSNMPMGAIVVIASTWAKEIYESLKNKPERFTILIATP